MTTLAQLDSTNRSASILTDGTSSVQKKATVGKDDFLKLLMAQLKNQDPLSPMESTEFTSQLAQFNSLEQLMQVNDALSEIKNSLSVQGKDDPLDYVGRKVKAAGNAITLKDQLADEGTYLLDEDAQVSISIYNDQGREVRRIDGGWQSKGEHGVSWDGKDSAGKVLQDGGYTFEVQAKNARGASVPVSGYVSGEATGVKYQNGVPLIMVGNRMITQEKIIEVTK
jgi:flagellar basal-body rod modification protein FlgD